MLQANSSSNVTFFKAPILEGISGVAHGFSTRREGSPVPLTGAGKPRGQSERDGFMTALGLAGWPVGRLHQVHSNIVHHVDDNAFANTAPDGDAAYTGLTGMALEVRTADCVPILIADGSARVVAIAHAGWLGTSAGLVRKVVDSIVSEFDISAGDLAVAMGPHIGVCCMEVGEEVFDWYADPDIFRRKPEWAKPHLNLGEANRRQLVDAGVGADMIQISTLCTRCRPHMFHSYRRDGDTAGRMFSIIGIQP
jgi:YfiH family protein